MKHRFSFSVFLLLLPGLRCSGLSCGPDQYPFEDQKCCRKCGPGTEMRDRCTKDTDTLCEPCAKGSYNSVPSTWECSTCTHCDPAHVFRVEECKSTSDTVCMCLSGYEAVKYESNKKRCERCPQGHFSKSGDTKCRPWTDCEAKGKNTVQAGTTEEDAVCGNPPLVSQATELPIKRSPKLKTARATSVIKPTFKPTFKILHTSIAVSPGDPSSGVQKSGYLSYILIGAALLLMAGIIILLKVFRKTKTYKEPGRFAQQMQKDGKNSFRIPIQEEQINTKSSLVQN